jgi:hypothetical protein
VADNIDIVLTSPIDAKALADIVLEQFRERANRGQRLFRSEGCSCGPACPCRRKS